MHSDFVTLKWKNLRVVFLLFLTWKKYYLFSRGGDWNNKWKMLDKKTSSIPTWEMPYGHLIVDFLGIRVSCCCWFYLFMSLQLSLLMDLFLLSSGAKRTNFIIPREVLVNEVNLKMDVVTPSAAAAATSCAADAPHPHQPPSCRLHLQAHHKKTSQKKS